MKNQTMSEWVLNPKNIEHGILAVQVGKGSIPVKNKMCPLCNPSGKILKEYQKLSDEAIIQLVKEDKLHGWSHIHGPMAIYENKLYHAKCLKAHLGSKYPNNRDIIEVQ